MIGEGTHSTNQRKHSYVRDNVEVGFFTDPTVCIGCKACEVACKEWNQVPDDGFTWSGNSYDNTGHLGASTWRHVMFWNRTGKKEVRSSAPISWVVATEKTRFAGFFCPMFASIARKRVVLKRVQPDQSCGRKSAPSSCKTMFAMAAAIAWSRARLV